MSMQEAFDRGDFLMVVESADKVFTPEEKLLVGISLFKLGRFSDALAVFRELSDLVRKLSKTFQYMALIHKDRGETETARFCLERYSTFYPEDDEVFEILEPKEQPPDFVSVASPELAKVYAAQGHFEQALDIYVNLLKDPNADPAIAKEARRVESMYIIKTLEGWVERLRQ